MLMGNRSAPNARYHEPFRGVGFQRLFKHGERRFDMYLINRFKTSKRCPACETENLSMFRVVPNPRFFRRRGC
ncbi:hypothetical protein BX666DRAFT_1852793 [Dichotomocladium elegans]|nr:hypothetical protein BX666DRAFT_1852793 [Dichotomocladium elegans]